MGCILPTMHCRSQTCWELLHPFAHHCQHARNNSQHCWRNNIGSCCARLHALTPVQTDPSLLANNSQHCWMLHVPSVCTPCCILLHVVACCCAKFETSQCWIRLHSSSNIVGATRAHNAWFTKSYGLYPSHDALQVTTLLGVVASVCTPLPTRTQQIPTMLGVVAFVCTQP